MGKMFKSSTSQGVQLGKRPASSSAALGKRGKKRATEREEETRTPILLTVKSQDKEVEFRVKPTIKMEKILRVFCEKARVEYSTMKFFIESQSFPVNKTPVELHLINGDEIKAESTSQGVQLGKRPASSSAALEKRGKKRATEREEETHGLIELTVQSQDNEVYFKVKRTIKMEKILRMFCEKARLEYRTMKFFIDSQRFPVNKTPDELHLINGDEIKAESTSQGVQLGKRPASSSAALEKRATEREEETHGLIELTVQSQDNEVYFKVKRTIKMEKILRMFCEKAQLEYRTMKFFIDSQRFPVNKTPDELHLINGDEIKAESTSQGVQLVKRPASSSTALEKRATEREEETHGLIELTVQSQDNEVYFKVKRTIKMEKILRMFCEKAQLEYRTMKFFIDSQRFPVNKTPDELHLSNGDEIKAEHKR